jgi:primary-amine oxidase
MTATFDKPISQKISALIHPLEPLSPEEVRQAGGLLKELRSLSATTRFMGVTLHEPPKDCVLCFKSGDPIDRQTEIVLMDNATGEVVEAIISITQRFIVSWRVVEGVQPGIVLDEFIECENAVKASREFQEALRSQAL